MNFDLSEEQELFTSTIERFSAPIDVEARRKLRMIEGGYDRGRWNELAELGLIALAASEDDGGMGGSPLDLALVGEAIGKANAVDPWLENGVLPARLLAAAGDARLESLLSGESVAAFAWAERNQRYCLAPEKMRLTPSGDQVVLAGEKTAILGAGIADLLIITALDENGATRFVCLPKDHSGLELRHYRMADGSIAAELQALQAHVSPSDVLDISEADFERVVADVRLLAGAEMVGLAQRLQDETLNYVKEREQFGVAIGSFQALQHRLVDCYSLLEQARSMLYRAALEDRSSIEGWSRSSAGAKTFIAEAADHIAREAVQMHGGMGITEELAIGHAMKRVLLLSKLFGDADHTLSEYAKAA